MISPPRFAPRWQQASTPGRSRGQSPPRSVPLVRTSHRHSWMPLPLPQPDGLSVHRSAPRDVHRNAALSAPLSVRRSAECCPPLRHPNPPRPLEATTVARAWSASRGELQSGRASTARRGRPQRTRLELPRTSQDGQPGATSPRGRPIGRCSEGVGSAPRTCCKRSAGVSLPPALPAVRHVCATGTVCQRHSGGAISARRDCSGSPRPHSQGSHEMPQCNFGTSRGDRWRRGVGLSAVVSTRRAAWACPRTHFVGGSTRCTRTLPRCEGRPRWQSVAGNISYS